MPRYTNPYPQYFTATGEPVLSGLVYFYESNTNTLKTIYDDSEETIAIANPVTLKADGSIPDVFYSGSARVKLVSSAGVEIFDRDPVGGESQLGNLSVWGSGFIYSVDDVVKAADGEYYRSLQNANQDNNPTASPSSSEFWEQVAFLGLYNDKITYLQGDITRTLDGRMWRSIVADNLNNNPANDDGTNWRGVSNESWYTHEASFTAIKNAKHHVTALVSAVEATQPTYTEGDYIVFANSPESTELLRVLNPSNTIQGAAGTVSAGDDLTLDAGQTVHLVAINSNTLKVV